MIRATSFIRAGRWSGVATDSVLLAYDDRHRRRFAMRGEGGLEFLLDLAEATHLGDGDGLVLEDGRMVAVKAKPEPLLVVEARDALHLARIAWHLGNRHSQHRSATGASTSAPTMSWPRCWPASAPRCPRSRRRSIRNPARMVGIPSRKTTITERILTRPVIMYS